MFMEVPKRALIVVSHAMERAFDDAGAAEDGDPTGLVIGMFQHRHYFDVEAGRYAALAAAGHTVVVGFVGSVEGLPAGVHAVPFAASDPRARDWVVVLVRGPYANTMVAEDINRLAEGEETLEASRLFTARWTFRRGLGLEEAGAQLARLAADLPPEVLGAAAAQLRRSRGFPVSPVEDQLAIAADHLVRSVELGHRRANRLRVALQSSQSMAERDHLTGLGNRHFLERYLGGGSGLDRPVDLLTVLIDVDDLKTVNDTHGHAAGDAVLAAIADTLRRQSRPGDVLIRWGGDEFLLIASGLDAESGLRYGERLARAVRAARPLPPWSELPLSASFAVSVTQATPLPFAELDAALYEVKRAGKGRAGLAGAPPPPPGVRPTRGTPSLTSMVRPAESG